MLTVRMLTIQVEYELDFGGEAVDASAVFEMAFTELQEGRRELASVSHIVIMLSITNFTLNAVLLVCFLHVCSSSKLLNTAG